MANEIRTIRIYISSLFEGLRLLIHSLQLFLLRCAKVDDALLRFCHCLEFLNTSSCFDRMIRKLEDVLMLQFPEVGEVSEQIGDLTCIKNVDSTLARSS